MERFEFEVNGNRHSGGVIRSGDLGEICLEWFRLYNDNNIAVLGDIFDNQKGKYFDPLPNLFNESTYHT